MVIVLQGTLEPGFNPLDSERVAVKTEPYSGRWITHIVIGSVDEIDGELMAWLSEAYAFAEAK